MSDDKRMIEFDFEGRVISEVIDDNIELSEMTPDEVINALNRAVGKYAYYASLRADAKKMQSNIEAQEQHWNAVKYKEVTDNPDFKKATVKAIEAQIIIDNEKQWKQLQKKKSSIQHVCDQLYVLVNSFELMTKTLQSVLAMMRAELGSAAQGGSVRGTGNLMND